MAARHEDEVEFAPPSVQTSSPTLRGAAPNVTIRLVAAAAAVSSSSSASASASSVPPGTELIINDDELSSNVGFIPGHTPAGPGHPLPLPPPIMSTNDSVVHRNPWDPPRLRELVGMSVTSFLSCGAIHLLCKALCPEELLARVSAQDRVYIPEMVVSTLHGLTVGVGGLKIYLDGDFRSDIFKPFPKLLDYTFSVSVGYSIWDMAVMTMHHEPLSMWIHHLVVATGCFLMSCYRCAAFYPALFQISELTVLPANLHWYLQKFQLTADTIHYYGATGDKPTRSVTNSSFWLTWWRKLYTLNFVARVVFHWLFRVRLGPYAMYHSIVTNQNSPAVFWSRFRQCPWPVIVGNLFNVSFLSFMNVIWTRKTIQALVAHLRSSFGTAAE